MNDTSGSVRWDTSGHFLDTFNDNFKGGACKSNETMSFYVVHALGKSSTNRQKSPENITIRISDLMNNNSATKIHTIPCQNGHW